MERQTDIFYRGLKRDIENFYDNEFMGAEVTRIRHLKLLDDSYNPRRFINCVDLETERIEFLTELQVKLEDQTCFEG
jgi:hypothetical protein